MDRRRSPPAAVSPLECPGAAQLPSMPSAPARPREPFLVYAVTRANWRMKGPMQQGPRGKPADGPRHRRPTFPMRAHRAVGANRIGRPLAAQPAPPTSPRAVRAAQAGSRRQCQLSVSRWLAQRLTSRRRKHGDHRRRPSRKPYTHPPLSQPWLFPTPRPQGRSWSKCCHGRTVTKPSPWSKEMRLDVALSQPRRRRGRGAARGNTPGNPPSRTSPALSAAGGRWSCPNRSAVWFLKPLPVRAALAHGAWFSL